LLQALLGVGHLLAENLGPFGELETLQVGRNRDIALRQRVHDRREALWVGPFELQREEIAVLVDVGVERLTEPPRPIARRGDGELHAAV